MSDSILGAIENENKFKKSFKGIERTEEPYMRMIIFKDDVKTIAVWTQDIHVIELSTSTEGKLVIFTNLLKIVLDGQNLEALIELFQMSSVKNITVSQFDEDVDDPGQTIVTSFEASNPEENEENEEDAYQDELDELH